MYLIIKTLNRNSKYEHETRFISFSTMTLNVKKMYHRHIGQLYKIKS